MAGEMLRRNAARAPRDQRKILLARCGVEFVFRMRVKPRAVTPERVHQQQFRGQRGGGHVFAFELRDGIARAERMSVTGDS